jgi:hypothetical protein
LETIGQRQKQPSVIGASESINVSVAQMHSAEETMVNTPYPEYLQASQTLMGFLVHDPPHWSHHQPKDHANAQLCWPRIGFDVPIERSKGEIQDDIIAADKLLLRADEMMSSPPFQYQSPASCPQLGTNTSNHSMRSSKPRQGSSQMQQGQSDFVPSNAVSFIALPTMLTARELSYASCSTNFSTIRAVTQTQQ